MECTEVLGFLQFYVLRFVLDELSDIIVKADTDEPLFATDKVALLIGNMSYKNHSQLKAPMVDVYELTNLLRQLDFKVVSLLDLTEVEMRNTVNEFLLLLDKGVYGIHSPGHQITGIGRVRLAWKRIQSPLYQVEMKVFLLAQGV
ncbi:unnamed protein product [Ranitomeya imitator]|uniref:Caspase family p20 domain-containing protein n=1 Tax=Ranitomeya imitator TaxID=111125 RepID=A0ABN9LMK1_9NEOB|nr:unnamed protein product [Ranitomeya imitator]